MKTEDEKWTQYSGDLNTAHKNTLDFNFLDQNFQFKIFLASKSLSIRYTEKWPLINFKDLKKYTNERICKIIYLFFFLN